MSLPKLSLTPVPARQAEHLRRWLREWQAYCALKSLPAESESIEVEQALLSAPVKEFDARPESFRSGQIRLLSRHLVPQARRQVYVLVLDDAWAPGWKLIAPFSHMAQPGTTGELLTGLTSPPLRVLSLWNARSMPDDVLRESWIVGEVPAPLLEEAWDVFRFVVTGESLPTALQERIGPPVDYADDPRCQYQEEEAELFAPLGEAMSRWLEEHENESKARQRQAETQESRSGRGVRPEAVPIGREICPPGFAPPPPFLVKSPETEDVVSLSAAEPSGSSEKAVYEVTELQVRLVLRPETDKKKISIKIRDLTGHSSGSLDGAQLLNALGEPVCVIANHAARVSWDAFARGLAVRTPDGRQLQPRLVA